MNKQKWMTAAAVLTLSASLAFAGPHGGKHRGDKGGRGAAMSERLAAKLNLTDTQKQQIRDLSESFRTQNQPLFAAAKQTRTDLKAAREAGDTARAQQLAAALETQHAQLKQAREAQTERVRALLTTEQRAQWDTMKAERKNKRNRQ
jgi:Spy/CpxP family protein refolding chaperone